MTVLLVGNETGTPIAGTDGWVFRLHRFQATATGTISHIRLQVGGDSHVKVALYADNAGEPGSRLAKQNTSTAVTTGWNLIALEASCSVVQDSWYWLAQINDGSTNSIDYDATARTQCYKAATYSTFTFPDPAGTGFTSSDAYDAYIAGYGVYLSITGQVTLGGSGVSGATVRLIKQSTNTAIATTTTDVNGNYAFDATSLDNAVDYHVVVEYTSGGTKYNAPSLWNLTPL